MFASSYQNGYYSSDINHCFISILHILLQIMKRILALWILALPLFAMAQGSCSTTLFNGTGTYYTSSGITACSIDTSEAGHYYCAMNQPQYNTASYCGTCIQATGSAGTQILTVNDLCSSCASGNIDMSPAAFQAVVGNLSQGSGAISWKEVPCPYSGQPIWLTNVISNSYFAYFLIHHATNEIAAVEVYLNSSWTALVRTTDNHWQTSLNNDTLLNVRVTDVYGGQIIISNVNMNVTNQSYYATSNFAPCVNTGINEFARNENIKVVSANENVNVVSTIPFSMVELMDITGKLLRSVRLENPVMLYEISDATLAKGVYIIRVYDRNSNSQRISFVK